MQTNHGSGECQAAQHNRHERMLMHMPDIRMFHTIARTPFRTSLIFCIILYPHTLVKPGTNKIQAAKTLYERPFLWLHHTTKTPKSQGLSLVCGRCMLYAYEGGGCPWRWNSYRRCTR